MIGSTSLYVRFAPNQAESMTSNAREYSRNNMIASEDTRKANHLISDANAK